MAIDTVLSLLKSRERESAQRLIDWLKIPSVSTDPAYAPHCRTAAEWCAGQLRKAGLAKVELHETGTKDKPGHPVVFAHHPGPKGYKGPHMLFYGHYDVQPADPLNLWESPPFEPVIKPATPGGPGERIVARGAVDDKGQVACFLEAALAWKDSAGEVPCSMTILIEGEEESGSKNLYAYVDQRKAELKADVCVISDTGMPSATQPGITYGVRGLAYFEVTLTGPNQDLHSGLWGGKVPNPINELVMILSQLWDKNRRVQLPGFYDKVREPGADERAAWKKLPYDAAGMLKKIGLPPQSDIGEAGWSALEREWARPTCDINGIWGGYTGEGSKTVIASKASAKVSFRLVADQDPKDVQSAFRSFLNARTPPGCSWEVKDLSGGAGATVATDSPALHAARRALKTAAGVEPVLIKSGGSIPVVGMLKTKLGMDTILMGFGLDDDRVHSPNEKFELACFRMGARAHACLMHEFGLMGR